MSQRLLDRKLSGTGQPLDADECVLLALWLVRTRNRRYAQWAEDVLDDMGPRRYR